MHFEIVFAREMPGDIQYLPYKLNSGRGIHDFCRNGNHHVISVLVLIDEKTVVER